MPDPYFSEATQTFDEAAFVKWTHDVNPSAIAEFRSTKGRTQIGGGKLPLLLFTHTGRKSGARYTTPIVHLKVGERYVIIGSMGGSPAHPQWYHNLVADPLVVLEVGEEQFTARARVVEGEERAELFAMMAALAPEFESYSNRTTRVFPVVVFERV